MRCRHALSPRSPRFLASSVPSPPCVDASNLMRFLYSLLGTLNSSRKPLCLSDRFSPSHWKPLHGHGLVGQLESNFDPLSVCNFSPSVAVAPHSATAKKAAYDCGQGLSPVTPSRWRLRRALEGSKASLLARPLCPNHLFPHIKRPFCLQS